MLHFLLPWGTLVHLVHLLLYLVHLLHTDRSLATISYKSTAIAMFHLLIHLLSKFCYFAEKAGIYKMSKKYLGGVSFLLLWKWTCVQNLSQMFVCLFENWELNIFCADPLRDDGGNRLRQVIISTHPLQTQIQISYKHKYKYHMNTNKNINITQIKIFYRYKHEYKSKHKIWQVFFLFLFQY